MGGAIIRRDGVAGRITLDRPGALNAITHDICRATVAALDDWRHDDRIALVILDAAGDRAFSAGGDIAFMHAAGTRGDFGAGRGFWHDEYRMNLMLADYPKPVVAFMQGFVMGGGVGYGCHAAHRVAGETTQVAMPECGIGLIPDVGGSYLLARAPGQLGVYLGLTGARMGAGDAIAAGFANRFVPQGVWPALIAELCRTGDPALIAAAAEPAPDRPLADARAWIDAVFDAGRVGDMLVRLDADAGAMAAQARKALRRASPLSLVCALPMIRAQQARPDLRAALRQEYRFTWRALEHSDFVEGIRAQIIDKDRSPRWRHDGVESVSATEVAQMLAPLGADELTFVQEESEQ